MTDNLTKNDQLFRFKRDIYFLHWSFAQNNNYSNYTKELIHRFVLL